MRVEVLDKVERRRRWSAGEKTRLVEETLAPGARVSEIARRNGISASLLFTWRRQSRGNGTCPATVTHFAAVRVAEPDAGAEMPKLPANDAADLRPAAASRSGLIEISLGGGKRVRVDSSFDAAALARVLDVLERR
jgi:transposase